MHWHRCSQFATRKKMVTSAHTKQLKSLALKKLDHFLTSDAR